MSLNESEMIFNRLCNQRDGPVFDGKGATEANENLFDLSVIVPVYNGEWFLSKCMKVFYNKQQSIR